MSTVPDTVTELVISPSKLSVAVALGSVHVSPIFKVIVEEPFNVITGEIVSSVGHVPHSGILLSIKADRLVINESGMTLILDTHHSLIS